MTGIDGTVTAPPQDRPEHFVVPLTFGAEYVVEWQVAEGVRPADAVSPDVPPLRA